MQEGFTSILELNGKDKSQLGANVYKKFAIESGVQSDISLDQAYSLLEKIEAYDFDSDPLKNEFDEHVK